MKRTLIFQLLFVLCNVAVAQTIMVMPQWTPQAQFAGFYMAQEKGFYKAQGLKVVVLHPNAANPALKKFQDDKCDIITLQLLSAMESISKGVDMVNILQTSQNNSLIVVGGPKIKDLKDLRKARIARWFVGFYEAASALDKERNMHIQWIDVASGMNAFIAGAVDAMLAMTYNEYFQLLTSGTKIGKTFKFAEIGYNVPEDGLWVKRSYYENNKDKLRKFVEATKKGWLYARAHREETLDVVMKLVQKNHVGTNREHQKWMLSEILKLQEDPVSGKATFVLSRSSVDLANRVLLNAGKVKKEINFSNIAFDVW
jgi:NitT/TauT family transport system substrate-binding protein